MIFLYTFFAMPAFLVTGSIAYDLLLQYDGSFADGIDPDRLDELSVGYVTERLTRHHGGTAANIAWNLAILGQEVHISGSVGHDGEEYLERLKSRGVDVSLVRRSESDATATAIVGTDSAERQITFYHPGADDGSHAPDFDALRDRVAYAIVSPQSVPSMNRAARQCVEHGIPYVFDPGQQSLEFGHDELRRIVQGSAAIVANAYEWSLLRSSLGWAANEVLEYTGLLVVTHGEHGLNIQTIEKSIQIEAVPAPKLVNPTGAGDALRAGLVTGLALGWNVRDAARLGAVLASFVVEHEGPQMPECPLEEVYGRAEKAYGGRLPALNPEPAE